MDGKNLANREVLLFLPSFGSGGCEAFVVNVAVSLKELGWNPFIISIGEKETVYDNKLKKAKIERSVLLRNCNLNPAVLYVRAYRAWARFLANNPKRYSVVHFNIAQGEELPFVWMAKRCGIPVRILHSHNSQTNGRIKLWGHVLCKAMFGDVATHYLSCSHIAAEWNFPTEIISNKSYALIGNGIDTEAFRFNEAMRAVKRAELEVGSAHVYLNVGRLHRQKNQMFLLEVFSKILEEDSNALLLIVGAGELEGELKSRANSIGVASKVRWIKSCEDMPSIYWASDVFLLPSLFEGFPFSLIEAQAAGLPCVVSDLVSEQCAITDLCRFVPLVEDVFVNASMEALTRSVLDRVIFCNEVASNGYDVNVTTRKLLEIYEESL